MGAAGGRAAPSWRSLLLALCLLPVALPLLLLCLPLLCVAVAAARFRRRRRKLLTAGRSGCRVASGGGRRAPEDGEGHRAELLRKYLQDQMELVGADAGAGDDGGGGDRRQSSGQSHPQ
ncbi:hypothetical protein SEVIR_8G056100v4 [Setaria viridis]|uniref:Uncharacterized protein n=1 Tax=Setaria viridis TaxID=4556 RepID=A0A4U6TC45_SETVI|nr:uncharacterized protein LOC117866599 [Setaria viridis]TKV99620.1 hypothetical protein SEVIR_8G056100v2 [Setaria viridis]